MMMMMMPIEAMVLVGGIGLALVHIFSASTVRTRDYGVAWNMGARDEAQPPPSPLAGRLLRAQANYAETFPLVAALILLLLVTGRNDATSAAGAILWLAARLVYLPLYAAGVPRWRSLVFLLAMIGVAMLAWPLLAALV